MKKKPIRPDLPKEWKDKMEPALMKKLKECKKKSDKIEYSLGITKRKRNGYK